MKILIYIQLGIAASFFISCGNNQQENTATKPEQNAASINLKKSNGVFSPTGATTIPLDPSYCTAPDTSINVYNASKYISNYSGDKNLLPQQSFTFNCSDIIKYIDTVESKTIPNIPTIHFLLGEYNNSLYLFIALIDQSGEHYYYHATNGNKDSCYILSAQGTINKSPIMLMGNDTAITGYFSEAIPINNNKISADTLINNYFQAKTTKNTSGVYSWTYAADHFMRYLTSGNCNTLQFILAEQDSTSPLQLIIVAYDTTNKPMYFQYMNQPCVLENCNPCPTCLVYGNGSTIEPTCNQ